MLYEWFKDKVFDGPTGPGSYGKYLQSIVPMLAEVLRWTPRCGTVINAGGHLGQVSLALSVFFDHVITVEVAPDNFAWLSDNVAREPRIKTICGALGDGNPVSLVRAKYSPCHHAIGPGDIPCYRVDDLVHDRQLKLDTLILDLQGGDLVALQHATATMRTQKPTLVVEESVRWMRRYGRKPGDVEHFVAEYGYRKVSETDKDITYIVKG